MAITIDPLTYVIDIPQSDLTLVSGTLYKADTNNVRLELKTIEASEFGIVLPDTNVHNTTVELFGVIYARTIKIISPYTITFSPNAQWSVRLDGSNNNYGDIGDGILNQNQVQVIPTNSAGLQDLSTLLAAAYNNQVVINTIRGQAGTTTPIGTFFLPCNNMIDAESIASDLGIVNYIVGSDLFLNEDLNDGTPHNFIGTSPFLTVTCNPGADLTGTTFRNLTVEGELDGVNVLRECAIRTITAVSGYIDQCAFQTSVDINGDILILNSYSNVEGSGFPTIRGSAGNTIEVRDWHGSLEVENIVDSAHTFEGTGGRLIIDSTCTGGTIYIRGSWFEFVDNSGVGCTVLDERSTTELDPNDLATAIWDADKSNHLIVNSMGELQSDAGAAGNPWNSPTSGSNVPGTFGYLLQTTMIGLLNSIRNSIATAGSSFIKTVTGKQPNQK